MEIKVNSHLTITDFTPGQLKELKELCTFANPAHMVYLERAKLYPNILYTEEEPLGFIWSYHHENNILKVPTYLLDFIKSNYSIKKLVDERVKTKLPNNTLVRQFQYRKGQEEAVNALVKAEHGIICAPCGSGKTTILCGLISTLNVPTLILVHTEVLLNQTIKEIKQKLNYSAGKIGAGVWDVKPITVATVQTLNKKKVPEEIRNYFSMIAADECQFFAAPTFTNVIQKFNAYYKYGASATPTRADKLDKITEQTIGPIVHTISSEVPIAAGNTIKPTYEFIDTNFVPYKQFQVWEWPHHLNVILKNKNRNAFIVQQIKQKMSGYTLILTDRLAHLEFLAEEFSSFNPVIYHGKLSKKEREAVKNEWKNNKPKLTIATTDSIGVGTDVPFWEEVWLVSPTSNYNRLIQIAGRVSRSSEGKQHAKIWDFRDSNDSILRAKAKKRQEIYENL